MNEKDRTQVIALQKPANDDKEAWKAHWKQQGWQWRIEPEIDGERQKFLTERRSITSDIEQSIYPFKDIKLSRADVEWLLSTHGNGHGPVDWSDESQRKREGLDLRGADLCKVNLGGLPLACTCWGLIWHRRSSETEEQLEIAGAHLEGTDFRETSLEGSCFRGANLKKANLSRAHLAQADLTRTNLSDSTLREVDMRKAILIRAHLEGAMLSGADFEGADLRGAHLEGAILHRVNLMEADLRNAFFDTATSLDDIILSKGKDGCARLSGVHWGDVDLSVANWKSVKVLGDEQKAHQPKTADGEMKQRSERVNEYRAAVRATRQLAIMLRDQGLGGDADYFAYRARVLYRMERWWRLWSREQVQRPLIWIQLLLAWVLSTLFDLLAGYGYKPERAVFCYLVVITGFATAYVIFGHLLPLEALVFSLTSFHGRGFSPGENITLDNPLTVFAAMEAVVGLVIEISLISTVTQRLFGK